MQQKTKFLTNTYLIWFGIPVFIYQVLTARMISQIFGDLFLTQLLLIAVSYLGHSIGSLCGHRWKHGLFAAHLVLSGLNVLLLVFWQNSQYFLNWGNHGAFIGYLLFFGISFFSSLLFPLFFANVQSTSRTFNKVYFWFHFLVVFVLLWVDLFALNTLGISNLILILLALEAAWALYWWQDRKAGLITKINIAELVRDKKKILLPLFGLSIISGAIQSLLYRHIQTILAPLSFHYTLFLMGLLVGWSIASIWFFYQKKTRWLSWTGFKKKAPVLIAALTLWMFSWPPIWAALLDSAVITSLAPSTLIIRIFFVLVLIFPCAFFFGSLMPLTQKEEPQMPIGVLLATNSAGNALGIIFYVGFLFQWASSMQIMFALIAGSLFLLPRDKFKILQTAILVAVLVGLTWQLNTTYNWNLGSYYYRGLAAWIEKSEATVDTKVFRSHGSQVSVVEFSTGATMMFFNGHYSVYLPPGQKIAPADIMMGLPALHYIRNYDKALMIGLGTGFTGLGSAKIFKQFDIVDLDPTMLLVTKNFGAETSSLLQKPNVHFTEADGLTYVRTQKAKYNLIINNVPSPVYFAAGKLWTAEAFAAISDSLTDDGVFFQWLSGDFSPAEFQVVMNTLQTHFHHCDLYILDYHFHGLVCAKGDQRLSFSETPAAELAPLLKMSPESYLKVLNAISFKDLKIPLIPATTALNTLDRPTLEVLTSRNPPGWKTSDFNDKVFAGFGLSGKLQSEWPSSQQQEKCAEIAKWLNIDIFPGSSPCAAIDL